MNSVFTYTISVLEPQGPNAGHLSRERLFRLGTCCLQQGHTLPYLCDSCDGTGVERQIPPTLGIPFLALSVTPLWVQIWGVPVTGGWEEKIEREVVHQSLQGLGRNVHERNQPEVRILPTSNQN